MTLSASTASRRVTVFEARHISKIYRMGEVQVHALRDVNFDLYEGEVVVLLGPSGSGKSSLINILGGLDVPTSGTVHFRDHDLTTFDDAALTHYRLEHVGFVFQFYNLIPGQPHAKMWRWRINAIVWIRVSITWVTLQITTIRQQVEVGQRTIRSIS